MESEENNKNQPKINPVKSFLSGGFGGICTVLVGHPLDTIKVRLQTMPKPDPGKEPMYRGTIDCAAKTIKNEGIRGLYKGMSAPLTGVTPIFAVCFAGYSFGKSIQQKDDGKLTYPQIFLAGAFSGVVSMFIMAPGERIKCLLQVQQASTGPKKYNGMIDCAKKLYMAGGIKSIYKGSFATLLRDMPANGMYFLTYEYLQEQAKKRYQNDVGVYAALFAGGMAGVSYWVLGMPADVLKSRLQTDIPGKGTFFVVYEYLVEMRKKYDKFPNHPLSFEVIAGGIAGMFFWIAALPFDTLKSRLQAAEKDIYPRGIRSVYREVIRTDSPLVLYRGIGPCMIRAFPANAACMLGYQFFFDILDTMSPD